METAKVRHNLHSPWPLDSPCDRRVLVNSEVRTTVIVRVSDTTPKRPKSARSDILGISGTIDLC